MLIERKINMGFFFFTQNMQSKITLIDGVNVEQFIRSCADQQRNVK